MLLEMIDIPEVAAFAERRGDGGWSLFIRCPSCRRIHRHGGGAGREPSYGHRVGHCAGRDRAGGYVLVPGLMEKPVAGRGKRGDRSPSAVARMSDDGCRSRSGGSGDELEGSVASLKTGLRRYWLSAREGP